MKIGILGGTFDPVHNAHLNIAMEAKKQFELDRVLLMPSPNPPHKNKNKITSDFHRANMIKLAVKNLDGIEFSDFELKHPGTTYTADTLTALNDLYPQNQYYFIMGSDSLATFFHWYHPDVIAKKAVLLVAGRDDGSDKEMNTNIKKLESTFNAKTGIIDLKKSSLSSSNIRENMRFKQTQCIPDKVQEYIKENHLYSEGNMNKAMSLEEIKKDLEKRLPKKRFLHTTNVADTAVKMANAYNTNPNKAYMAGLLHDCAKYMDNQEYLEFCEKHDIAITSTERKSPGLLHAKVGAYFASNRYGVDDKEILSAITWHTTGKPDMTNLEAIIFSADYIEPSRKKQPNLEYLREIAYNDLDLLVFNILKDTLSYLEENNSIIDSYTRSAYDFYKTKVEK